MALECLCDFLAEPTFLVEMYVNYDCDMQASFTLLWRPLFVFSSSSASSSSSFSCCWKRGVVSILLQYSGTLAESVLGTPTSALPVAAAAAASTAAAATEAATAAGTTSNGRLPSPSRCREARRRKAALTRGARAFAMKPREGLKLLQREGLFRRPHQQQHQQSSLDAKEVAAFLRATPGLDKAAVGTYLGEAGAKRVNGRGGGGGSSEGTVAGDTEEFHAEVLEAFVDTFDFRGQGILASLRMFLGAFRLPGEAQQIDR
ncbi:unnamed protein product, partial [Ectocarpus sp. 12 AP-2014]